MTTPPFTTRPKVLHIYRTYFPDTQGGGEEVIRQICHNTLPKNIESRIFTLSPNPAQQPLRQQEAIVFQAQQHLEIASCGISFSASKLFREQAAWADILHYHFPWPFGDLLHLMHPGVTNKPTVISYHSDVVRQKKLFFFYKPLMRRFLKRVDHIIATSPNFAASSPLLQTCKGKVKVIPIGIDEETYPGVHSNLKDQYRKKYGDNFMFFIGVFRYYKGLKFLLEAAKSTSTPIVIAGAGPEEKSLKTFATQYQLANIHFVGRINDKQKIALLSACKGMVFPSHLPSESFGISLLEAAMLGKPMISCEIGTGTTYVNIHEETGLVVAPADPAALASAINRLSENNDLAAQLGAGARRRYEALFTGAKLGQQFAELYQKMLNEKGQVKSL